jgi:hypothetical protein
LSTEKHKISGRALKRARNRSDQVSTVTQLCLSACGSCFLQNRTRHATVSGQSRGQIVDAPLDPRKACRSGKSSGSRHWEGDLLSGANNSYIATLVERHSRFAMLVKVPGKDTKLSFEP